MKVPDLHHWRDTVYRDAAGHMALDESLFHWTLATGMASARFYHWDGPALTQGYFLRNDNTTSVRRLTGGGLVEHGEDLTFLLTFPPRSEAAAASSLRRYQWIHEALVLSLATVDFSVSLAPPETPATLGPCFEHLVPWDLIVPETGFKIGGGAQRRSRGAVIHQGSLRLPPALRFPEADWIDHFLDQIALAVHPLSAEDRDDLLTDSSARVSGRYGNAEWNQLPAFGD